ncbi:MAG TPA: DUF3857 domain-containing protein [Cryomorphaceae bacterium]|nr:DUF3857 domain-containing protein [Cryomorphaceae bacterium]
MNSNLLSIIPAQPYCSPWFILFFLLPLSSFGQESDNNGFRSIEIEKVTAADFTVPDSLYEEEDGAIYLFHTGRSKLEYDPRGKPELSLVKKFRILVLNEKGLDMADRAISLYIGKDDAQTIGGLHGKVYNLVSGEVEADRLKNSDWQIDEYNDNYKLARISFRNVKVGSIIELEYVVYDPFVFRMDDWDFQLEEPVIYSQYQVSYPSNFGYKILKLGYHPLDQSYTFTKRVMRGTGVAANFDYDQVNYLFSAKNIPALRPEPYIDSPENYRATILTELHYFDNDRTGERRFFYKDWRDAVDDFFDNGKNEDFLKADNLSGFFDPEVSHMSELDKIEDIYNQVRTAMRSSGEEGSINMDRKPRNILQSGAGTANEINMLLVSALRKNDIEAYPLLYAKRDRKKVLSEFPIFTQFQSVMAIAYVEDSYVLLDASDLTLTVGEIGEMSYNGEGLSAKPKEPMWFPLKSSMPSKQRCSIELSELDETSVKGEMRINLTGIYANRVRNKLSSMQASDLKDYFKLADGVSLEYSDSNVNDYADELEINFAIEIALETIGESFVFPAVVVEPITNNPFDKKERKYPVVFSDNWQESYTCLLRLDADRYDVVVPESKNLILPGEEAELNFAASYNFGSLVVRSSVKMNKDKYDLAKYGSLRTFYDQVVGAQASFIEIQKK